MDATAFLHGAIPAETLPAPVNKGGRPSSYTPALAEKICERISEGGKDSTLRAICADPDMPHRATVYRWLEEHADFRLLYGYAMQAKIEGEVEEIIEIADDASGDFVMEALDGEDGPAVPVLNKEAIARSKLRIEVRQWRAEKAMPRKYGILVGKEPDALPPPTGEDAKDMGTITVIENDPLHAELKAWGAVKR